MKPWGVRRRVEGVWVKVKEGQRDGGAGTGVLRHGLTWLSNNSFFDSRSRRYFACFLSAGVSVFPRGVLFVALICVWC